MVLFQELGGLGFWVARPWAGEAGGTGRKPPRRAPRLLGASADGELTAAVPGLKQPRLR